MRSVLNSANANIPKGHFSDGYHIWEVGANDQMFKAEDYRPLIVAYSNGAAGAVVRYRRRGRFGRGSAQRWAMRTASPR